MKAIMVSKDTWNRVRKMRMHYNMKNNHTVIKELMRVYNIWLKTPAVLPTEMYKSDDIVDGDDE